MKIRNRMKDIEKLRCNACQDYLKMVVIPDWQNELYQIAKDAIEKNNHSDKYISAYEKMRTIGIEKYTIEDMDVSLFAQIIRYCPDLVIDQHKNVKDSVNKLREDRNSENHSGENEEEEELYLIGLLALCNLRSFIRNVDKYETKIDDKERHKFREKYLSDVKKLMDTLDNERIELIQREKDIEKDIKQILDCTDEREKDKKWLEITEIYNKKSKLKGNNDDYYKFIIQASDEGIADAHCDTLVYFARRGNSAEMEKRIQMMLTSNAEFTESNAHKIINSIHTYQFKGNSLTERMNEYIELIINQGFPVKIVNGLVGWD